MTSGQSCISSISGSASAGSRGNITPNLKKVVYESLDTILYKCHEDEHYVSIVYFVPAVISKRIDAIYTSLHFERFIVPDEYNGTPGGGDRCTGTAD